MPLNLRLFPILLAVAVIGCQQRAPEAGAPAAEATSVAEREAPPASKMTEADFRKGMALEGVKEVRYVGEAGEALSFADFIAIVQAGRSFRKEMNADRSLAVMTVNPKGANPPEPAESRAQPINFPVSADLPPIRNKDLGGRLNVLANGRRPTLVSFFFPDCVPCIQEVPALNALTGDGALNVVSITFDDREAAAKFARERGLETSIVPDAQAYIDTLGIKVYPTLLLVSPEGRLMGVRSSYKVTDGKDGGLADLKAWMRSLGLET